MQLIQISRVSRITVRFSMGSQMTLYCVQYRLYIDDKEFNDIPNITKGARGNPRVILTDLLNHQLEEALRTQNHGLRCQGICKMTQYNNCTCRACRAVISKDARTVGLRQPYESQEILKEQQNCSDRRARFHKAPVGIPFQISFPQRKKPTGEV